MKWKTAEWENNDTIKHAKPVRCPLCRRKVPVLLFDSPSTGVVCARCHARLIEARQEQLLARKHGGTRPEPAGAGGRAATTLIGGLTSLVVRVFRPGFEAGK